MIFAAHCAEQFPSAENWTVHVGSTYQESMGKGDGQMSKCTDLVVHQNFAMSTKVSRPDPEYITSTTIKKYLKSSKLGLAKQSNTALLI